MRKLSEIEKPYLRKNAVNFAVGDNVDVCALVTADGHFVAASVTRLPPAG